MSLPIKVLLINGSPREHGNTSHMLSWLITSLEQQGITTDYFQIGGKSIKSCRSCWRCQKDGKCWQEDPVIDELCSKIVAADGVIIGSPTYYADVPMEVKGMLDRCGLIIGKHLKRKAGAAVVVARRGGAIHVYDTINHWFGMNNMYIVGSSYWNDGYNPQEKRIDGVEEDEEAKETMKNLAENMAFLLKSIKKE
ncbi:hypothetical protein EIN_149040 [Entamoeba invadens IP1]|uniref:NADPH-dependent FMN reductase-like domain-containing protein n=1 Tax=Entamoeba invadens IP1 TaxID=370355 RepID=L7FM63_ENTIV|nr:hypothetical protein EIN_149040 [Entamoeba invadens IP1]ELP85542.1 hypothetical protein EIN_149040 [Entamoeba invadens IP1]|eukprot:XP_004184888.1 hypothetical protein EIN_149040 [Entamoeba invadens IP1]